MSGPTQDQLAARGRPRPGRNGSWWLAGVGGLVGAVGAVLTTPASQDTGTRPLEAPYRQLAVFGAAFHAIRTLAADERSERQLIDAAAASMVASLDPYSRYLTAAELRRLDEEDIGSYTGIGVEV